MVCVALNTARTCECERLYSWLMRLWAGRFGGFQRVCSVYGALGLDLCGVYRVSSVYGVLGWTFGAFLQHLWHLWGVGVVRLALGSCLAFVRFFMLSIGGCLRVWRIGAQASPSHEPLLSELGIQLVGPFGLAWGLTAGGRGFASHGGATLSRGWLCQGGSPWTSRAPTSTSDAVVKLLLL